MQKSIFHLHPIPFPAPHLNHNYPLGVETVYTKLKFPFRLTSDFNYKINFQFINESAWTCIHLSLLKLTEEATFKL